MASLIDISYFFGDCAVGQLSEGSVQNKVTWFINQFEPEILTGLLGYATYQAFKDGLAATPVDAKWTNLKSGCMYVDLAGVQRKWRGLCNVNDTFKESPIAYYVYFKYQKNNVSNSGGSGEAILQGQNSAPVSPADKMRKAWNNMVYINRELFDFLYAKNSDYPDWLNSVYTVSGMYGAYEQNSPYNFLTTINSMF